MASDDDQDKRGDGKTNNWVWYLVLTSIILLSVGMFVVNNAIFRIKYPDFVRLLQAIRYAEKGSEELIGERNAEGDLLFPGSILVRAGSVTSELSQIRNVRVDETSISGELLKVTLEKGRAKGEGVKTEFRCNKDNSDETSTELRQYLDASNVSWDYSDGPSFMNQYGPVLVMVGAAFLIMMFAARRLGGIGSPMSFGRSRGKLYAQDDIGITFDDIAGVDEAVEEVREIVDFLKYPDKYQRLGGRIPKGVLLVGQPLIQLLPEQGIFPAMFQPHRQRFRLRPGVIQLRQHLIAAIKKCDGNMA